MKKCDKCGKSFSKEDFSKLKYKQSFIGHFADEMDPFNELTICPECIEPGKGKEKEKEYTGSDKNTEDAENEMVMGRKAKATLKKDSEY